MLNLLPEDSNTAAASAPTFLARKGVMMRHYHVVALWPDGRREKIGRFVRRPDAARWIKQKSAEWLAQYFCRVEDARSGIRAADGEASPTAA
jgi:hypothetical protein